MSIKDLIVYLDEETASEARLDAAIALALAFGARLVGLALVAQPFVPLVELPPERLFRERREARADTLLATAAARAGRGGVTFEMRRETAPADRLRREAGDGRIQARQHPPLRAAERGQAQRHEPVLQAAQVAMPQR